jgi:hypothetical protein
MCRGRPRVILGAMDETRLTVRVELLLTPDSLRGHLIGPTDERTEFLGRLGLFAAMECLVEAAVTRTADPEMGPRRPPRQQLTLR